MSQLVTTDTPQLRGNPVGYDEATLEQTHDKALFKKTKKPRSPAGLRLRP
ncbi:hypothetical protein P5P81_03225 [Tritonibacter mobilis]|nr:hypothetical protein [Tritonibacter mobilis]